MGSVHGSAKRVRCGRSRWSKSANLRSKCYHRKEPAGEPEYKRICSELAEKKICDDAANRHEPPKPLPWLKRTPPYALMRILRTRKRLKACNRQAAAGNVIPFSERNWYCGQTMQAAIRKHRSSGTDMPALYFRSDCQGADMMLSGWWSSPYMGFEEVCRGVFDAHVLGGTHDNILDHPEVANRVREAMK